MPLREHPRDVLVEPSSRDVRGAVDASVARERQHVARVDRARLEQLVDERAVQTVGRRVERVSIQQRRADERVTVGVQTAGREPHEEVALPHARGTEQIAVGHRPHAEPGQVELVLGHDARMLRGLSAQQRRIRPGGIPPRPLPRGRPRARARPCLRPRSRGRRAARHRCTRRRRRTSPRGRCPPCSAGRSHARSRAWSRPRRWRRRVGCLPRSGRAPRSPRPVRHLGPAHPRGEIRDQPHGLRPGLDVHAGPAVGVAHGMLTRWAASAGLPARTSPLARARGSGIPRRSRRHRTRRRCGRWPRPSPPETGSRASRRPRTRGSPPR